MWKNKPDGIIEKHWIDLIWQDGHEEGEDRWMEAAVKWDGCIHLCQAGNVPFAKEYGDGNSGEKRDKAACDDYIHICNLDQYIAILQKLRDKALEHFGQEWNKQ